MSDIKTEDNDDFIVSSSDLEKDEADIAFEAKEKKKKKSKIISRIILVISACVFIFAAYALFTTPKKFNINALTTNNILLIL